MTTHKVQELFSLFLEHILSISFYLFPLLHFYKIENEKELQ